MRGEPEIVQLLPCGPLLLFQLSRRPAAWIQQRQRLHSVFLPGEGFGAGALMSVPLLIEVVLYPPGDILAVRQAIDAPLPVAPALGASGGRGLLRPAAEAVRPVRDVLFTLFTDHPRSPPVEKATRWGGFYCVFSTSMLWLYLALPVTVGG